MGDNNLQNMFPQYCCNNIKWFQYRVQHRIIGVHDTLYKCKISDDNICRLCQTSVETISHLFAECEISNYLWENMILFWIQSLTGISIHLDKNVKLLGFLGPPSYFWPLNFILLLTIIFLQKQENQNHWTHANLRT